MTHGVGLAYFLGSQKELGPARLQGDAVEGKPDSNLDLGVVLLEHPLDYWAGQKLRQRLQDTLAPLFALLGLHLRLLEEENAHVQYAAIHGLQVYAVNEDFTRRYRRQALTLYGDWHSWGLNRRGLRRARQLPLEFYRVCQKLLQIAGL